MKYFVTGGSGFVGGALIQRLKGEGHAVSALVRSEKAKEKVEKLGATAVLGPFEAIAQWEDSLTGIDIVVHCAAPVEVWGKWSDFYEGISIASSQLLSACERHGVKKFIYLSSESVMQDGAPLLNVDESYPCPEEPNSYYGKAKKLAEEKIRAAKGNVARIVLRPAFIWGPGDNATPKIVEKVRKGQFLWIDSGRAPFECVHVQNVIEAICLAAEKAVDGSVYLVTDDRAPTTREFFTALFKAKGVLVPKLSAPKKLVRPLAAVMETLWRTLFSSRQPPLTRFEIDFVALPRRYNISKIRNELGYKPIVTWEEGLKELGQSARS